MNEKKETRPSAATLERAKVETAACGMASDSSCIVSQIGGWYKH